MFQFSIDSSAEIDSELFQIVRGHNVGIVLADSEKIPPSSSIFQYASAVMIDFTTYSPDDFAARLEDYKNHWDELQIAVDNLPEWRDQRHCLSLGARYSLGSFVFK